MAKNKIRTCRVCGCTDNMPCVYLKTGFTCRWVAKDLCSACQVKDSHKAAAAAMASGGG